MTTVAITGAAGLVGRRVVQRLLARADAPNVVAVDVHPPAESAPGLQYRAADIRDPQGLEDALADADVVVHLAAQLDELDDVEAMREVNVEGTRNVLAAAAAAGATKVVHLSSVVSYGAHADNPVPLTEERPLRANPDFPYAEQKAEGDRLVTAWAEAHGDVTTTVLRPAMILGSGVDNFIVRGFQTPRLISVRGHRPPMQFVHVDDVASAVVHAVEHDLPGAYNVAAEGWLSQDEIAAILHRRHMEVPEEVAFTALERGRRLGLVETSIGILAYLMHPWVVSVDRLVATGWRAEHSNRDALALLAAEQGDRIVVGPVTTNRATVRRAATVSLGAAGGLLALGMMARRRHRREDD